MCLANIDKRMKISIHALREEGDQRRGGKKSSVANFYPRPPRGGRLAGRFHLPILLRFLSTPSARRATASKHFPLLHTKISIHALREEGDCQNI